MKAIRILLTLMGATVAVVLTLLVLFIYNPSWQKALIDGILENDTAREWKLGQIHLSPGAIELSDVFILSDEFGLEMKRFRVEGSFWVGIWKRSLEVETGEVEGLFIDLSRMKVDGRRSQDWEDFVKRLEADPQIWKERIGLVLSRIESHGWHLRLEKIELSGGVLLPDEQYIPVKVRILDADSRTPEDLTLELSRAFSGENI